MKRRFTRSAALAAWFVLVMLGLRPAAWAQAYVTTWQWAQRGIGTGAATSSSSGNDVQVDLAGNTYVTGAFSGQLRLGSTTLTTTSPQSGYLVKYAPGGSVAWVRQLSGSGQGNFNYHLGLDGAGNVYLAGYLFDSLAIGSITLTDPTVVAPSQGQANGFVAKLDPAGAVQWAVRLGPEVGASFGTASCNGLAVDAAGNVAVAGFFSGLVIVAGRLVQATTASGVGLYVARLPASGSAAPTAQWVRTTDTNSLAVDATVAFDRTGGVYVGTSIVGSVTFDNQSLPGTNTLPETVLAKYDATGTVQWATRLGNPLASMPQATASVLDVVADPIGQVYVLYEGTALTASFHRSVVLAQYSDQGAWGWEQTFNTTDVATSAGGLALDGVHNVYLAGRLTADLTLDWVTLTNPGAAASEAFVFCFTPLGTTRYGFKVSSGAGNEALTAVAMSPDDVLHATGYMQGPAELFPFTLATTDPNPQMLAGRFTIIAVTGTHPATASPLLLAPNPAHHTTTLTLPAASAPQPLALLDALGRPVRRYTVPAGASAATLDVTGLPAGLYVLRGAGASRKLVVE